MRQFSFFTLISGLGWLGDFSLLTTLLALGYPVFLANFIGAFVAVTFVFFIARKHIFSTVPERSLKTTLGLYWVWQACAITAASAATAALAGLLFEQNILDTLFSAGMSAKILVTPVTLIANFVFMRTLLERRSAS